jgi:hypothetical protein
MNNEPEEPKDTDPVTHQELLRLLSEQRKATEKILDQRVERLERELSLKRSQEGLKRSEDWLNRITSAAIGFGIGMVFTLGMSECSHFSNRLNTIESKQH